MVIYMFVEEVNSKDDAQAAKVEITGEKDVTIGASLTLDCERHSEGSQVRPCRPAISGTMTDSPAILWFFRGRH